jgi:hypothetical protein
MDHLPVKLTGYTQKAEKRRDVPNESFFTDLFLKISAYVGFQNVCGIGTVRLDKREKSPVQGEFQIEIGSQFGGRETLHAKRDGTACQQVRATPAELSSRGAAESEPPTA